MGSHGRRQCGEVSTSKGGQFEEGDGTSRRWRWILRGGQTHPAAQPDLQHLQAVIPSDPAQGSAGACGVEACEVRFCHLLSGMAGVRLAAMTASFLLPFVFV